MRDDRNILVVEDSRFQARQLKEFLEAKGYRVTVATDGAQGLAVARKLKPAVIVSDIMMPVMNGFEMCRAIKTDQELKSIPVILLTSLSKTEDIICGLQAGADSYVSKPCDGNILLSRIRTVVSSPLVDDTDGSDVKLQIVLKGKSYRIDSSRQKILLFLLSTYQDAVVQNQRLEKMRQKLEALNEQLDQKVKERTAALEREIGERKQAQAALAQQAQELARSNADLAQFAYVASHDLQEPLRMVSSYTQLLARRYKGKLDADADEFINYAVDGVMRMKALINDLLAYSRVGTRGREPVPTSFEQVLSDVLANLQSTIEESKAVITHDPLPVLKVDPTQMIQLLQNLIGNAIKFRGQLPPRIHISAERLPGEWLFTVQDNGIGIDPAHTSRIFEIFQRLHSSSEYPGTGIGLAICKKIIERHHGRIWVESELGKGSSFHFTIPEPAD